MATIPSRAAVTYPTSDGKPMAETEVHMLNMFHLIQALSAFYQGDPMACASGNMLMYYVEGDRRRHVSPDVFVTLGIPRRVRENYLVWAEGKAPDLVIELTSKSTRREDVRTKFDLYRDVLKVREYILFDPLGDYLDPSLRGHRLVGGQYVPIDLVDGRLPSDVLGLSFERSGQYLRLYNPATGLWLPTERETEAARREAVEALQQADLAARRSDEARIRAEASAGRSDAARIRAEADRDRLLAELEALRKERGGP